MRIFGNIIWHIPFMGFIFAFVYALLGLLLCCTVILIPVGKGYLQFARFLLTPFTSSMVSSKDLKILYPKEESPLHTYSTIIRVLFFPIGLIASIFAIFLIIAEFISIIGIPSGIVWSKSLKTIFNPVNKECVPRALAEEIERAKALGQINKGYTNSNKEQEKPGKIDKTTTNIRSYTDTKLEEIITNEHMYNPSLVLQCKEEIEIRTQSTEFYKQVETLPTIKLNEYLNNPDTYSPQFIYACHREINIRNEIRERERIEKEKQQQELQEQERAEKKEQYNKMWLKWRFAILGIIITILICGATIGIYKYREQQEKLRLEQIALEEKIAQEVILKEKQAAEQREKEAKQKIKEAEKQKEIAAAKAEATRLNSDINYRHSKGIYRIGDYHKANNGIVIMIKGEGKKGTTLSLIEQPKGTWINAKNKFSTLSTNRLPTVNELKSIYKNISKINQALIKAEGEELKRSYGAHYWSDESYGRASAWTISMYDGASNSPHRESTQNLRTVSGF